MSVDPNPYGASPHAPPPPPPAADTPSISAGTRSFTIRRIDPLSVAKLFGTLYALLGLLFGAFVSLLAVLGVAAGGGVFEGLIGGLGAVIIFPIIYGAMGLLAGLIGALLYNLVAGMVGGIILDLES